MLSGGTGATGERVLRALRPAAAPWGRSTAGTTGGGSGLHPKKLRSLPPAPSGSRRSREGGVSAAGDVRGARTAYGVVAPGLG